MDLKIKDVAELLNVSETTIRRWLAEGKIPAYRIHHQYRFSRMEIEDWVMSCRLKQVKGNFLPVEEEQIYPVKDEAGSVDEGTTSTVGQQQFSLFRAIHRGDVLGHTSSTTKEGIIKETVSVIASRLGLDAAVLTDLLLDRERLMPTALNNGIAVPHTREFLIKKPFDVMVVVYPNKSVDWGALDGKPAHTLFFLFASDDKRHLHLLAKIAHLSSDEETLKYLQSKPSKQELLEFVKDWEAGIKSKATVS
ncbi:PTS sugar transporter subunit IIA [Candidatus Aerophobetes bacterium]|uniref:PTS sugar transporter subunit IIA n=1 Tax=Aerophobetes bacterium TaxID=2030807 RepID=A0A2A4YJU4_UNCAE|nr:MAG: PTS sugar transporter subunit IIA [Candidatus Aerophobetes bacterium]